MRDSLRNRQCFCDFKPSRRGRARLGGLRCSAPVGFLFCLVISALAAQAESWPFKNQAKKTLPSAAVLQGVILEGGPTPADRTSTTVRFQDQSESEEATATAATCDKCQHDWNECCCDGPCWNFFGQYLLLQPRGADPVFAVEAATCTSPPLGDAEQLDFGAESGFKVGFARLLHDGCSDIGASFTHFESEQSASTRATPGSVLRPLLTHPALTSCDALTSFFAAADGGIDFDRVDIDYRRYFNCGCTTYHWLAGFGYGQLNQDLQARYGSSPAALDDIVNVDSDLFGYGVRFGGGAEYGTKRCRGFGNSTLTLLASNVTARYQQIDIAAGQVAEYKQDLDRIVPVLDLEMGMAVDLCRNTVLQFGYTYSIWFNVVTTPEFVSAVQKGEVDGSVSDTLSFDGLFARVVVYW